jgi:hypothetical protein
MWFKMISFAWEQSNKHCDQSLVAIAPGSSGVSRNHAHAPFVAATGNLYIQVGLLATDAFCAAVQARQDPGFPRLPTSLKTVGTGGACVGRGCYHRYTGLCRKAPSQPFTEENTYQKPALPGLTADLV